MANDAGQGRRGAARALLLRSCNGGLARLHGCAGVVAPVARWCWGGGATWARVLRRRRCALVISQDSGEYDDFSAIGNSSTGRTNATGKMKFFGKLRRLLHGKDGHRHHSQVSPRETFVLRETSHDLLELLPICDVHVHVYYD